MENGRLREYIARGFIKPKWPASGHGSKNYLNKNDLIKIEIFKTLLNIGFSRKLSAKIISEIKINQNVIFLKINLKEIKNRIGANRGVQP